MAKVLATYQNTTGSDWSQVPDDIRNYFIDIINSSGSYHVIENPENPLQKHDYKVESIVMATSITLATGIGAILNASIIFRMAPLAFKKHRLEIVFELLTFIGWFLFQTVCIPAMLTHDVLVVPWKFGNAMCKIVPLMTKTVKYAQCFTFLVIALALAVRTFRPRPRAVRCLDCVPLCIIVPVLMWIAMGLLVTPIILEFGVVDYGIEELAQCFNIDAVMDPSYNWTIVLHYFLWMMIVPLFGTIVIYIVTKVIKCSRYIPVTYENVENDGDLNVNLYRTNTEPYFRYLLVQLVCFSVPWLAFEIMAVSMAYGSLHAWLPHHTAMFNITMVLAYSQPCLMAILTTVLHPKLKFKKGLCKRNRNNRDSDARANVSFLQDVDASFEREPNDDIIVYSARQPTDSELALL